MTFAKAIAGGLTGLLGSLAAQLDAVESFGNVSDLGWVLVASATLGGFTAVYFVPNRKAKKKAKKK